MKHIKILPLVQLACLSPITISLVSCSKTVNWKQETLDEFLGSEKHNIAGVVSVPRPGYYHDKIIPYLTDRIMNIAHLKKDDIYIDRSGNIVFDIPASKGYENKDMVILQGHSDMIVAGLSEQEAKTTPIDAVIDGNEIHSRDYKTSLGADNGIGLSMALALMKNTNSFKHGPLRFIFTADEDVGMVGANKLKAAALMKDGKTIKWLINIDAENLNAITRSCNGNIRLEMGASVDPGTIGLGKTYKLTIDGLTGGHSGIDIVKHRANSDKLVYDFFAKVEAEGGEIQLASHNHEHTIDGKTIDVNYSLNQIIANSSVVFNCNGPNMNIDNLRNLLNLKKAEWSGKYVGDDWNTVKCDIVEVPTASKYLDAFYSNWIIEMLGSPNDDAQAPSLEHFYYGPFIFQDEEETTPDASANIGPFTIEYDSQQNKMNINLGTSCRTSILEERAKHSILWFARQYTKIAKNYKLGIHSQSIYHPWPKDENNHLVELLSEGYRQQGIEPVIEDVIAGIEPAIWYYKSGRLITCACLGAHVDNAHSCNETLYVDTIEPTIKNIVYALEELAK